MKTTRYPAALLLAALAPWLSAGRVEAQSVSPGPPSVSDVPQAVVVTGRADTSDVAQAIVISVNGRCEVSEDGQTFSSLKHDRVLHQGAVLRTGDGARADLFFRRIGTSVRVQPDSELKLETMTRSAGGAAGSTTDTLLDLRKGRIFTVVRELVPGTTFEIRNAAGRSVVEGGGSGRYIITADGTHVADKASKATLKVVGETGITVIAPGEVFRSSEGRMQPVTAPEEVLKLLEWDQLRAFAESSGSPHLATPETKNK